MEFLDAEGLIRETRRRADRRRRLLLAGIASPTIGGLAALTAWGILPWVPALIEATIVVATAVLLGWRTIEDCRIAERIDRHLAAKDRFLTLASTPSGAGGLLRFVVVDAGRLAARTSAAALVPSPSWSTTIGAAVGSMVIFAVATVPFLEARTTHPPVDPLRLRRIEDLARVVAASPVAREARIGEQVIEILPVLRDPSVRPEDKRDRTLPIFDLYGQETGSVPGDLDLPGAYGGGQGRGSGKGSGQQDGAGSGELDTGSPVERLMQELERLRGELEGRRGSPSAASRAKGEGSGGGEESAGETNEAGEHPEDAGGGSDPTLARATPKESGPGEGVDAESPEDSSQSSGGEEVAAAGISRAPEGSADRSSVKPAERYHAPGEEPPGWRVEGGRYVRVWVPEGDLSQEIDRVREAGGILPRTPLGDAPLPSAGPAGAPRPLAEVPLEYRGILNPEETESR